MRTAPPVSGAARKKTSSTNLRAGYSFGSLGMATEQTCRQLRAYRKKLTSADPIAGPVLAELDQELRLTAAALGDRAIRSKAMSEELNGLLDQKLERLVSLLDEKWRLQHRKLDADAESTSQDDAAAAAAERPHTASERSSSVSGSN